MARPAFGYRNANGDKVPGSTTVLKYATFMDTDILCNWAAKLAKEGKDWKLVRRSAGEHGSHLHDLCEKRLPHVLSTADRVPGLDDATWGKLVQSYDAIRDWYVKYEPKVVYAEEPLVSEAFQFAGTPDAVWLLGKDIPYDGGVFPAGSQVLGDYKTGRMVGAKEIAQMASYRQLLKENGIADVVGSILIHAPTAQPGYMRPIALDAGVLDLGWEAFLAAKSVMNLLPKLSEVCA
jgi:hypothetical protein